MKTEELMVLGLAGIAVYMILRSKGGAAGSYTFGSQAPAFNFGGLSLGSGWAALPGAGGVTVNPEGKLNMPAVLFGGGASGSW
jgi:hypothetical protein